MLFRNVFKFVLNVDKNNEICDRVVGLSVACVQIAYATVSSNVLVVCTPIANIL